VIQKPPKGGGLGQSWTVAPQEGKGKERKGKERKGKERKGKERKTFPMYRL
jgi:hypothetical protein